MAILTEGFENGDYTTSPVWTTGSGSFSVQDTIKHSGTYALKYINAADNTLQTPIIGDAVNYSCYLYYASTGNCRYGISENFICGETNGSWQYLSTGGWHSFGVGGGSTGTWYESQIIHTSGTTVADMAMREDNGTLIASVAGVTMYGGAMVYKIYLQGKASSGMYFDDVVYGAEDNIEYLDPDADDGTNEWSVVTG